MFTFGNYLSCISSWQSDRLTRRLGTGKVTAMLFFSLPLMEKKNTQEMEMAVEPDEDKTLSLRQIVRISGAKEVMVCFFCYCALEGTAGLWAISGFITMKLDDTQMIRLGQGLIAAGIVFMLLPGTAVLTLIGLILVGLGCAPVLSRIDSESV